MNRELLINGLKQIGIIPTEDQVVGFETLHRLIVALNKKINITAIINDNDFMIKHILDSLVPSKYFIFNDQKIADIGTGGGFPGIPIKIIFKNTRISLIDSSKKKNDALKEIGNTLDLKEVNYISRNIEIIGQDLDHRGKYDIVLCRAVAEMRVIIEYAIPLLKINGTLIAYKGPNVDKEVENSKNALNELRSIIKNSIDIKLPYSDHQRRIYFVEKKGETPLIYPRKIGIPKKRPL